MNLTIDPWIPIVWGDGRPGRVSLREAFERGEGIRDLAVRPHERIALMRLLICIAQAALDGPADYDDWKSCRPKIAPAALGYLKQWQSAFELFGEGPRFLQVKGDGQLGTMELDKLGFVDADMTTLFDQDVELGRQHNPEWVALRLVAYQSFAAGGTVGGSFQKGGRLQPQKGKNGPCRDSSAFHAFIRRENIISTLHSNMVAKERISNLESLTWGTPVWEARATELRELQPIGHLTRSYLGRLAPLSRAVWLNGDGATALNANGLLYPSYADEGIREPTTSVRVVEDKDGQHRRVLLSAIDGDNIKKPWRELHALTVKRISDQGVGGPFALGNLDDDDETFDLWVGAVVTGQAKIEDTVESTYSVPKGMLNDTAQRAYETGVRHAETWERRLRHAIAIYRLATETRETTKEQLEARFHRLKKFERRRLAGIGDKAYSSYWTIIEHRLELLSHFALEPIPTRDGKIRYRETDWGKHVPRGAHRSFELACPHETPRQIRAYALGLQALFGKRAVQDAAKAEREVEA
jgi:CRISPR system Cascade subunit CasA